MNINDDWENSCLCLEDGIEPAASTFITFQSIYNQCLEGEYTMFNEDSIYCVCGCGQTVKKGNKYILGHNSKIKLNSGVFKNGFIPYNKGVPQSEENKEKNRLGHIGQVPWMKGKKHTEEAKQKQSNSHKGIPTWNKGMKCPEISERQMGEKNHMFGKVSPLNGIKRPDLTGENSNAWNGGKKLSWARSHAKRKELFGFIPLNKPQDGFEGHHLDFSNVIFIPEELHKSVWHSVIANRNMNEINDKVCDWYLEFQGVS